MNSPRKNKEQERNPPPCHADNQIKDPSICLPANKPIAELPNSRIFPFEARDRGVAHASKESTDTNFEPQQYLS